MTEESTELDNLQDMLSVLNTSGDLVEGIFQSASVLKNRKFCKPRGVEHNQSHKKCLRGNSCQLDELELSDDDEKVSDKESTVEINGEEDESFLCLPGIHNKRKFATKEDKTGKKNSATAIRPPAVLKSSFELYSKSRRKSPKGSSKQRKKTALSRFGGKITNTILSKISKSNSNCKARVTIKSSCSSINNQLEEKKKKSVVISIASWISIFNRNSRGTLETDDLSITSQDMLDIED